MKRRLSFEWQLYLFYVLPRRPSIDLHRDREFAIHDRCRRCRSTSHDRRRLWWRRDVTLERTDAPRAPLSSTLSRPSAKWRRITSKLNQLSPVSSRFHRVAGLPISFSFLGRDELDFTQLLIDFVLFFASLIRLDWVFMYLIGFSLFYRH